MSEQGSNGRKLEPSSSSTRAKPKFQPKIQKKVAEVDILIVDETKPSVVIKEETDSSMVHSSKAQKLLNARPRDTNRENSNTVSNNSNSGSRGGRGSGGRGRGKAIAVIGATFFRGNNMLQPPIVHNLIPSTTMTNDVNNSIQSSTSDNSFIKVENSSVVKKSDSKKAISSLLSSSTKNVHFPNVDPRDRDRMIEEKEEEDNYDDNDDDGDDDRIDNRNVSTDSGINNNSSSNNMMWPPVDVNPLAPLELPIGPKSIFARESFDNKALFADPENHEALEQEQSSEMFLIQLPNDLRLSRHMKRNQSTDLTREDKSTNVNSGKIGKLLIMKSGKVILVSDKDEKKYTVKPGMTCSFAQYAAAISVDQTSPSTIMTSLSSLSSSSSSSSSVTTSSTKINSSSSHSSSHSEVVHIKTEHTGIGKKGSIHLLGSITRKVVVTPDYEIGTRLNSTMHSTSNMNSNTANTTGFHSTTSGLSSSSELNDRVNIQTRVLRSESIGTEISETDYDKVGEPMMVDYVSDDD